MSRLPGWVQKWVVQITIGFLFGGCFLRTAIQYSHNPNEKTAILLLFLWLAIFFTEPFLSKLWNGYFYFYLVIQSLLVLYLLRNFPANDYFSILFAGLSMQIMYRISPRIGVAIIAMYTPMIIIGVFPYYELSKTLPLALIYTTANAFLGACAYSVRKAREEREKENHLLLELEMANEQLEISARKSEQLSVARERSGLALELHDSVTQTIFSMVLTTRSAVILLEQDPSRVGVQLVHLDQLVRSALDELKKLVRGLKPEVEKPPSLLDLLEDHALKLKEGGFEVSLNSTGNENLSPEEVKCLFRIAQESLNNVVKHACVSSALIKLDFSHPPRMEIIDDGVGFATTTHTGGLGLKGMKERAAGIGWTFEINSHPGNGTRVFIQKNGG